MVNVIFTKKKMVNLNKPKTKMIMKKAKIEALVIFDDTVWREFS